MPPPLIECIFCGLTKPRNREHVIQDALGGVDLLDNVCEPCNRLLAVNDKVLAVESPLSILARRELRGVGPNSWDVDHARDSLLLEAKVTPDSDSMTLVPQVVFDGDERPIYCDGDDFIELGHTECEDPFYTRLRRAFGHYRIYGPRAKKRDHKGADMLKFNPAHRIRDFYRLPPRICCNKPLTRFDAKPIMFDLRYLTNGDRDRVLDILSKLNWSSRARESKLQLGSKLPEVNIQFCLTHAIQALTKIGFNLLAFFCKSTRVNCTAFSQTVEWVVAGTNPHEFNDVDRFGFIDPAGVAELTCPPKSHKFRLAHDLSTNTWKMYASFFEGKAAAHVAFRGPNAESWATMDVEAPYDRPMRPPTFDNWYRPLDTRAVLEIPEILPTIPWQTGEMRVKRLPAST